LYNCPGDTPKHMSVAVNKWKYRLQYLNYFGGVTALSTEQVLKHKLKQDRNQLTDVINNSQTMIDFNNYKAILHSKCY
jgi:hypothetical protein